jgi:hypothetical protein
VVTTDTHPLLFRGILAIARELLREMTCEAGIKICSPSCPHFRAVQKIWQFEHDMATWGWQIRFARIENWLRRRR